MNNEEVGIELQLTTDWKDPVNRKKGMEGERETEKETNIFKLSVNPQHRRKVVFPREQ